MKNEYCGVFANLITSLATADGDFDPGIMRDHVDWVVGNGVHGVSCLLGSGGFTYLTRAQRRDVIRCVADSARGRVKVLAGIMGETTKHTIELGQDAIEAGADVVVAQARSYIPLTRDEAVAHFCRVADAMSVPIGIYNHPRSTGFTISPDIYKELIDKAGAILTKDGGSDVSNVPNVTSICGENFAYLSGHPEVMLGAFAMGADGCDVALGSVIPKELVELYTAACEDKDLVKAQQIFSRLLPVLQAFKRIGTPRAAKAAARILGVASPIQPQPVLPITADDEKILRNALAQANILRA